MYYLLGGAKEQRAVYHGQQTRGLACSDTTRAVYFYPAEYITTGLGYTGSPEAISPLITAPDGTRRFRISDHLASLRVELGPSGTGHYDYDPWGEPAAVPPAPVSRTTHNNAEQDPESGDYSSGVRQSDPRLGRRFNSVDALAEKQPGVSPYAYCNDNPLRYTDPTGKQCRQIPAQDPGADGAWQTGGGFDIGPEVAFDAEERALAAKQLDEEAEEMGLAVRARMVRMETQEINELTKQLEVEAQQAIEKVGPGKGSTYGTKAHTAFENEVKELKLSNVRTEVSYKGQAEARRGAAGSVRLDVVKYDANGKMSAIYDLKTGDAKMTAQRIAQIRANLPPGCADVPIIVIKP